jgi:hypothetical protein
VSPLGQAILDQCAVLAALKPYCDEAPTAADAKQEEISDEDLTEWQARAKVARPAWKRALARLMDMLDGYSGEPTP